MKVSQPQSSRSPLQRLVALLLLGLTAACAHDGPSGPAELAGYAEEKPTRGAYLFGWPDFPEAAVPLRGGTSTGAPVIPSSTPSADWGALRSEGLSAQERDQAAIRALAGDYRASFDFLETVVFADGYIREPATPYRSWATERIYVLEDRPGFVSLQHLLVMFAIDEEGELLGPFVQKHWRQDWSYQPAAVFEYRGFGRIDRRTLSVAESEGRWSQAVFQVDDTPRYTLLGRWTHRPTDSTWSSEEGWRPLPRREHTVRDDYHVMGGTNRIIVLPTGWVHSQDNTKIVLTDVGKIDAFTPLLAREIGVNRYDRIEDFDFSAGDVYWEQKAAFWSKVRDAWADRLEANVRLEIADRCGDEDGFALLFSLAERAGEAGSGDLADEVGAVLDCLTGAQEGIPST